MKTHWKRTSEFIHLKVWSLTAVPTPALLPGLLVLRAGVLRNRKQQAVEAVVLSRAASGKSRLCVDSGSQS
ncbi:PTPA-CTERM sorting domain-containing protein [Phormidesmis sp. 146-35]